ncbi:hypothetical protein F6V25_16400 [Oryzomonas japonica]|uniref:Uncharacterized protein n=1 Tax=Oryzomonas japonica TaxID=2603858 RepID=A0A7J4ZLW5_9BACT|nr:hypothetical protein [Oryzomonas japonica]KAB0663581.1 hypothetical protein F6V25_16400 [Oryzomonas japonica]
MNRKRISSLQVKSLRRVPDNKHPSIDKLYSEVYSELRRYRDNIFQWQRWYTTVILALVGGLFFLCEKGRSPDIPVYKFIFILIILILTLTVVWLLRYTRSRTRQLTKIAVRMEPHWRVQFKLRPNHKGPSTFFIIINWALALVTTCFIYILPPLGTEKTKAITSEAPPKLKVGVKTGNKSLSVVGKTSIYATNARKTMILHPSYYKYTSMEISKNINCICIDNTASPDRYFSSPEGVVGSVIKK